MADATVFGFFLFRALAGFGFSHSSGAALLTHSPASRSPPSQQVAEPRGIGRNGWQKKLRRRPAFFLADACWNKISAASNSRAKYRCVAESRSGSVANLAAAHSGVSDHLVDINNRVSSGPGRGTSRVAVKRATSLWRSERAAVTNVHAPQQVVLRDTLLESELVKQLALIPPSPSHHRRAPLLTKLS